MWFDIDYRILYENIFTKITSVFTNARDNHEIIADNLLKFKEKYERFSFKITKNR